jgi:hypothetical protein
MANIKWALLCGGDFYFDGTARSKDGRMRTIPNLEGCVQDVKDTFEILCNLGVNRDNIRTLTATCGVDQPVKEKDRWPT